MCDGVGERDVVEMKQSGWEKRGCGAWKEGEGGEAKWKTKGEDRKCVARTACEAVMHSAHVEQEAVPHPPPRFPLFLKFLEMENALICSKIAMYTSNEKTDEISNFIVASTFCFISKIFMVHNLSYQVYILVKYQ